MTEPTSLIVEREIMSRTGEYLLAFCTLFCVIMGLLYFIKGVEGLLIGFFCQAASVPSAIVAVMWVSRRDS